MEDDDVQHRYSGASSGGQVSSDADWYTDIAPSSTPAVSSYVEPPVPPPAPKKAVTAAIATSLAAFIDHILVDGCYLKTAPRLIIKAELESAMSVATRDGVMLDQPNKLVPAAQLFRDAGVTVVAMKKISENSPTLDPLHLVRALTVHADFDVAVLLLQQSSKSVNCIIGTAKNITSGPVYISVHAGHLGLSHLQVFSSPEEVKDLAQNCEIAYYATLHGPDDVPTPTEAPKATRVDTGKEHWLVQAKVEELKKLYKAAAESDNAYKTELPPIPQDTTLEHKPEMDQYITDLTMDYKPGITPEAVEVEQAVTAAAATEQVNTASAETTAVVAEEEEQDESAGGGIPMEMGESAPVSSEGKRKRTPLKAATKKAAKRTTSTAK